MSFFFSLRLKFSVTKEMELYASIMYLKLIKDSMALEYVIILSYTLEYY